jgi:UTP--glucose-1-phosphate uridylyltransferase
MDLKNNKKRKAVIPAAGLGTRVLPATKAMPKEMLSIVDKPAIQYIVEECVNSGITDILIIISRNKDIICNHFDRSPELESRLKNSTLLEEVLKIPRMANISYIRQQELTGLGSAILLAENFVGNDPFAVLYADDVIIGDDPCIGQLCRAYEQTGRCCAAIKEVGSDDSIQKYSSLKVEKQQDNIYNVTDMVEKPAPGKELSNFAIWGRVLLTPEIFDILKSTEYGAGGELQLTDAMKILAQRDGMTGVDFTGKRYDMGNKLGVLQANVELALKHPIIGNDFRHYLKSLILN